MLTLAKWATSGTVRCRAAGADHWPACCSLARVLLTAGRQALVGETDSGHVVPAQDLQNPAQPVRHRVQGQVPRHGVPGVGLGHADDRAETGEIAELHPGQVDVDVAARVQGVEVLHQAPVAGLVDLPGDDQPRHVVRRGDPQRVVSHGAPGRPGIRARWAAYPARGDQAFSSTCPISTTTYRRAYARAQS